MVKGLIFISGPLTAGAIDKSTGAFNAWNYERNIQLAERQVVALNRAGYATICVHSESRNMFGEMAEEHALASGIIKLLNCDGLCLSKGWESLESGGTQGEIRVAYLRGIPIYLDANGVIDGKPITLDPRITEIVANG